MSDLIQELQFLAEVRGVKPDKILIESADTLLGALYARLANDGLYDINIQDTAEILAGLTVLGKRDYRQSFPDLADNVVVLRILNDLGEQDQKKMFTDSSRNEPDGKNHVLNTMTADEKIKDLASFASKLVQDYSDLIEKAKGGDATALRRLSGLVGQMRTFYGRIRQTLVAQVRQTLKL